MKLSVLDWIILVPALPLLAIAWLPLERWVWKHTSKRVLGPYLLYGAFAAWHFQSPTWLIVGVVIAGGVISVMGVVEKGKDGTSEGD